MVHWSPDELRKGWMYITFQRQRLSMKSKPEFSHIFYNKADLDVLLPALDGNITLVSSSITEKNELTFELYEYVGSKYSTVHLSSLASTCSLCENYQKPKSSHHALRLCKHKVYHFTFNILYTHCASKYYNTVSLCTSFVF